MTTHVKYWNKADLKLAYKRAREAVQQRARTFEKQGYKGGIPKKWRDGIKTAGQFESRAELLQAYKEMDKWLSKDSSRIAGYKNQLRERMESFNENYGDLGLYFNNLREFDEFGRFMGDMEERAGEQWAGKGGSDGAIDLWIVAKEKGIDPNMLMKNFEYWMEHLQDLQKAERIKGEDLTPGAYRRKLGLETISSFYKREGYERMYNKGSKGRKGKKK